MDSGCKNILNSLFRGSNWSNSLNARMQSNSLIHTWWPIRCCYDRTHTYIHSCTQTFTSSAGLTSAKFSSAMMFPEINKFNYPRVQYTLARKKWVTLVFAPNETCAYAFRTYFQYPSSFVHWYQSCSHDSFVKKARILLIVEGLGTQRPYKPLFVST